MKHVRVQLLDSNTGKYIEDVDVLSSADCIKFNDGQNLQQKFDSGVLSNKLVDDVTNVEITISDMDAEIGEARKGKTTLQERLEEDKSNILSKIGQVNENKTEGKVRFINNSNKDILGLTFPCTCIQLAEAMKNGDVLYGDSYLISDAPTAYGQLFIMRENDNRVGFQYRSCGGDGDNALNQIFIASYRSASTNKFSGWKELVTSETSILTLLNGWVQYDRARAPKAIKVGNLVSLNIHMYSGRITSGTCITQLPSNLRPTTGSIFFSAYDENGVSIGGICIEQNGDVKICNISGNFNVTINASFCI